MNWAVRIKTLLGVFWNTFFGSVDFLGAVKDILGLFMLSCGNGQANWMAGQTMFPLTVSQDSAPYAVDIITESYGPAYVSFEDVFSSGSQHTFDELDSANGYVGKLRNPIACPDILVDHVLGSKVVLIRGIDFTLAEDGTSLIFKNDISILNLPRSKELDASGNITRYWRFFGFTYSDYYRSDAVGGFISHTLDPYAIDAWRVHVDGASKYAVKKLLADVSDSVVCEETGIFEKVVAENEQGLKWIQVGNRLYSAPADSIPNVQLGAEVQAGTVLFGSLAMYGSEDSPSETDVPGILVNTDVGELFAVNAPQTIPAVAMPNGNVLPLSGARQADYYALCNSLMANEEVPYIEVPDQVNPYQFIMQVLRYRRSEFISLSVEQLESTETALDVIRKGTCANAVVTVFVRAAGEPVSVEIHGFSTDVCMSCVAEYVSVSLWPGEAEVRQLV